MTKVVQVRARGHPIRASAVAGVALALLMTSGMANALDEKEADFARSVTGMLFLTMMCKDYAPQSEVLKYLGKRSLGEDKSKKVLFAVGAELTKTLRAGGMKLEDGEAAAAADLIPEISKIVDENLSGLMDLWRKDKDKTCRDLGDIAVTNGLAEKAK
jgi:hypothetical protein